MKATKSKNPVVLDVAKVPAVCKFCGKSQDVKPTKGGVARVPKSWHEHPEGGLACKECWAARFRLRAVTFPVWRAEEGTEVTPEVVVPVSEDSTSSLRRLAPPIPWPDLRVILRTAWSQVTGLSNWTVTQLAARDTPRLPTDEKLGKAPTPYLYPEARALFPNLAPQTVASVLQSVASKYSKKRKETHWLCSAALSTHRYAVPYPVHNQSWRAVTVVAYDPFDEPYRVPAVSVPLGGRRITLLLASEGRDRQCEQFGQILNGAAIKGELAIYRKRSHQRGNRGGAGKPGAVEDRAAGGHQRVYHDVMVKLVAWFPRDPSITEKVRRGVLEVRTGSHALFVAVSEGRQRPWVLRCNQVRRWVRLHSRRIQEAADDAKCETRRPKRRRVQALDYLDRICAKQKARLNDFLHRASAWLANYAERIGVREVIYDDRDKRYCDPFPWFVLRQRLAEKVRDHGLIFTHTTPEDASEEVVNGDE